MKTKRDSRAKRAVRKCVTAPVAAIAVAFLVVLSIIPITLITIINFLSARPTSEEREDKFKPEFQKLWACKLGRLIGWSMFWMPITVILVAVSATGALMDRLLYGEKFSENFSKDCRSFLENAQGLDVTGKGYRIINYQLGVPVPRNLFALEG